MRLSTCFIIIDASLPLCQRKATLHISKIRGMEILLGHIHQIFFPTEKKIMRERERGRKEWRAGECLRAQGDLQLSVTAATNSLAVCACEKVGSYNHVLSRRASLQCHILSLSCWHRGTIKGTLACGRVASQGQDGLPGTSCHCPRGRAGERRGGGTLMERLSSFFTVV